MYEKSVLMVIVILKISLSKKVKHGFQFKENIFHNESICSHENVNYSWFLFYLADIIIFMGVSSVLGLWAMGTFKPQFHLNLRTRAVK